MQSTTPEQTRAAKTYTTALIALSNVALSSAERLLALNLNTARAVFQDGLASKGLMQMKDGGDLANLQLAFSGPAAEQCISYFRGLQEIAVDSQQEVAQVLTSYFTSAGFDGVANGTNAGLGMFSKFMKDANSMVEANAKAMGDATMNMMTPATSNRRTAT